MFLFARKFQFCAMLVLSPEDKVIRAKYDAEKSFHRTEMIRLDMDSWSGKCKRV